MPNELSQKRDWTPAEIGCLAALAALLMSEIVGHILLTILGFGPMIAAFGVGAAALLAALVVVAAARFRRNRRLAAPRN